MCEETNHGEEKKDSKNHSLKRSGQSDSAPDNEESSRDQNLEAETIECEREAIAFSLYGFK